MLGDVGAGAILVGMTAIAELGLCLHHAQARGLPPPISFTCNYSGIL
jgi:hypothetical protein